jgi:hypothetical protein
MGFDSTPRLLSKNFSFIYVSRTFLDQRVNVIGKSIETGERVKLEDVLVKQKGTGGYIAMDVKFKDIPMRFYVFKKEYKENMESLGL